VPALDGAAAREVACNVLPGKRLFELRVIARFLAESRSAPGGKGLTGGGSLLILLILPGELCPGSGREDPAPEKGTVRTRSLGTAGMGRQPRKAEQALTL
jgi:hypothetical protein